VGGGRDERSAAVRVRGARRWRAGRALEYFRTALEWLAARPDVDPSRIFVSGGSRGAEAALLLAANFPDLVHGVIASSPDNVAVCSAATGESSWTLNGDPVACSHYRGPAGDNPAAAIPVEKIRGPLFMDCGRLDAIKNSCGAGQAILDRLAAHHVAGPHLLLAYPRAGHLVDSMIPYWPVVLEPTDFADQQAHADLWPRLLAFLDKNGR
jgi:dienelactone hydrolase